MKKTVTIIAFLILVCALSACGPRKNNTDNTSEELAAQQAVPADDASGFVGTWAYGRCSMIITPKDDVFICKISWPTSATETVDWSYNCSFEEGALVGDGQGVKTVTTDGGKAETVYEDGEVKFEITLNGMVLWRDAKEDAGDGLIFEKKVVTE